MRRTRLTSVVFAVVCLAAAAVAGPVSGTITNATNGKPASGATVTVLDPMAGMLEVGSGKADARGRYSIEVPPAKGPRLVRAERGGVNYFKMIPPGVENADVDVYDAASSVKGIKGTADVLRLETKGDTLEAAELFVLSNQSKPPKALSAPATFEFVLPAGATIDGAHARAPNGQPISVQTKPMKGKDHYAFTFALKPGDTRLQVDFHLPYKGQLMFSPRLLRSFEHYVVVLPDSMNFIAHDPKQFQTMDANQPGTAVQVSMQAKDGEKLGFSVSGMGTFPEQTASAAPAGSPQAGGPGGGLGKPIDAPDSLAKYRFYILAALVIILIGGGIWIHERTSKEAVAAAIGTDAPAAAASAAGASASGGGAAAAPAQPAAKAANPLLAALKEEIFALEVDFKEGKVSQEEYNKARAALDQTLQRAISRKDS